VSSNAADVVVALSGTGAQTELTAEIASIAFGAQDIAAGALTVVDAITNTGTETVSFTGMAFAGGGDGFSLSVLHPGDCSPLTTLAAGQSCDVRLSYDPTIAGPTSDSVTISSTAPDVVIAVTGIGTNGTVTTAQQACESLGITYAGPHTVDGKSVYFTCGEGDGLPLSSVNLLANLSLHVDYCRPISGHFGVFRDASRHYFYGCVQ